MPTNNDYRSDEDDDVSSISLSIASNEEISKVMSDSGSEYEKREKKKRTKRDNKKQQKQNGKQNRKLTKDDKRLRKLNKLVDDQAEETEEEESDYLDEDGRGPDINRRDQEKYHQDFLKRKHTRPNLDELAEKYKDGNDIDLLEVEQSDEIDYQLPGIRDPKFWRVFCNRGKENEAVTSIMYKYQHLLHTDQPLNLVSVFALKKFPGALFVESMFESNVLRAIEGINIIRQTGLDIIDPQQVPGLFTDPETEELNIVEGQWIRIRQHHLYQGDLARVMNVDQEKRLIKLKVIQRQKILLKSAKDDDNTTKNTKGKKDQNRFQIKEEQDELQLEEMMIEDQNNQFKNDYNRRNKFFKRNKFLADQKKYVRGPKIPLQVQKKIHLSENDESEPKSAYFYSSIRDEWTQAKKDGFELITLPVHHIITGNIKPTPQELMFFYPDVKDVKQIILQNYTSLKQVLEVKSKIQVGDTVHVQGAKAKFKVVKVNTETDKLYVEKVQIDKETGEKKILSYIVSLSEAQLAFSLYQQVMIIAGPNSGQSGAIIKMDDNTATITTEANKIIKAQLTDLQLQKNVLKMPEKDMSDLVLDPTQNNTNGIKRNDLIKFGQIDMDIGCVLNISNQEINVLDLTNTIKIINQMAVISTIHTRNNVAKNIHGNDIRQQDLVVILDGFYKNNNATVLHVYRDYLFLFNGRFDNTQGVIIEKVNNCGLISSNANPNQIKFKQTQQQPNNDNQSTKGSTDDLKSLVGQYIQIKKGQYSGYKGLVLNVTPKAISVQLTAKNLTVKVPIDQIRQDQHIQSQLAPGKTPHHAPGMSTRVWDDLDNKASVMHGYQSPYVYHQTPMHD